MLYGMTNANLKRALEDAGRSVARTKMVNVRVTEAELAQLETAAGAHRLPVATFVRAVTFAALAELATKRGRGKR